MSVPLPEPQFIERDGATILAEVIAAYEAETQAPLPPAHPFRLLLNIVAYRETLVRIAVQEAAKQNLPRYARYPMIDLLAELVGGSRLAAKPATTTMQFALAIVQVADVVVPAGYQVRTNDGRVIFAADADVTIPAGQLVSTGPATANQNGAIGNGYAPGQVSAIVTPLSPVPVTATNVTETDGGSASESTEALQRRFPTINDVAAVAGPGRLYKALALAAHPDVIDAAISTPEAGTVRVALLSRTGVPGTELLEAVEAALSPDDVRPMNDAVVVAACTEEDFSLSVELTELAPGLSEYDGITAAQRAIGEYLVERQNKLGLDLDELAARIKVTAEGLPNGVLGVSVVSPAEGEIGPDVWAHCSSIQVAVP